MTASGQPTTALAPSLSARLLSVALLAVAVLEIAARITDRPAVQVASWCAIGSVILLALPRLSLREAYLLSASAVFALLAWMRLDNPAAVLAGALNNAAFLMAFLLLIGLLNAAAGSSPAVAKLGAYMTRQPPGRRYSTLYAGTGVLSVLFNIGTVSLLVPLIQRGIDLATPNDPLNPVRERRQITAMTRGFAWAVVWSPTAIAPLILLELLPQADRGRWIAYGLLLAMLVLALGWAEDRLRFRRHRPSGARATLAFPATAARDFAAVCLSFFALICAVLWLTGESFVFGLLLSCPAMVVFWLMAQRRSWRVGARVRQIAFDDPPKSVNIAVTLACSGFLGRTAAAQIPAADLAAWLGIDAMPDYLLLSLIPPAIWAVSLLAFSPTMLAVFFGSLFAALPVLPTDTTLIALAISCGWALSMTLSPFATVILIIDRVSGIPATRLSFGWNAGFTIGCAVLMVPFFALLTGGR